MIFRSNLKAPDLSQHFQMLCPAKQICGHDAPSDPDFEPNCTFWTHDEAAILYNVVKQTEGAWFDIGSRFGWTTAHIAAAGASRVIGIDTIYAYTSPLLRAICNTEFVRRNITFDHSREGLSGGIGCVIDADHDSPWPMNDARWAVHPDRMHKVILFHDFWGQPIRDAVSWLMDGYQCRIYNTPNGVALLWRGLPNFVPPDHTPDPIVQWASFRANCTEFDFGRCV